MSSYEVGPIRPPSEAESLLIRITRSCQWNRCGFCPVYKELPFELRERSEIEEVHFRHLAGESREGARRGHVRHDGARPEPSDQDLLGVKATHSSPSN